MRHAAAHAFGSCGYLQKRQPGCGAGKRPEPHQRRRHFRSAAALGMDAVLLSPGCSDPLYRRCVRVSMGTVFQIPWAYLPSWPDESMEMLGKLGFKTAAMALCDDSVSIDDKNLMAEDKLAIVMGSEGDGLTEHTIAACDYTVKIPMYHDVDSLNVAAASAVAFWQLRRK